MSQNDKWRPVSVTICICVGMAGGLVAWLVEKLLAPQLGEAVSVIGRLTSSETGVMSILVFGSALGYAVAAFIRSALTWLGSATPSNILAFWIAVTGFSGGVMIISIPLAFQYPGVIWVTGCLAMASAVVTRRATIARQSYDSTLGGH